MQQCPVCTAGVTDSAFECRECSEPLAVWRKLELSAGQVRDRGLRQAGREDYLGALISFLESALTNPLGSEAWLDVARALVHLGRIEDALRFLDLTQRRAATSGAAELATAIREVIQQETAAREAAAKVQVPVAPATSTTSTSENAPPPVDPFLPSESPATETPVTDAPVADSSGATTPPPQATSGTEAPVSSAPQRKLLGLSAMPRKRSFLQRVAGTGIDPLWEAILTTEAKNHVTPLEGTAWWELLARHQPPHSALLYLHGLERWQRHDLPGAQTAFVQALQNGSPVLNPVGYLLCCACHEDTATQQQIRLLRDLGVQTDEIRQVLQQLQSRAVRLGAAQETEELRRVEQACEA